MDHDHQLERYSVSDVEQMELLVIDDSDAGPMCVIHIVSVHPLDIHDATSPLILIPLLRLPPF